MHNHKNVTSKQSIQPVNGPPVHAVRIPGTRLYTTAASLTHASAIHLTSHPTADTLTAMAARAQAVNEHVAVTEQEALQEPVPVSQETAAKLVPKKRPLEEESAMPPPKRKRNPTRTATGTKQDVSVEEKEDSRDMRGPALNDDNPDLRPDGTDPKYDSSRLVSWAFNVSYTRSEKPRDLKYIQDEVFQVRDFQIAVKHLERSINIQETRAVELKEELEELGGTTPKKAGSKKVRVSTNTIVNAFTAYHQTDTLEPF